MTKKKWVSAAELMAELSTEAQRTAQQVQRRQEQAQRQAQVEHVAAPIIQDLNGAGIEVSSLEELEKYSPLPPSAVQILLDWLERAEDPAVIEQLVRLLSLSDQGFHGAPLVGVFDRNESELLRWSIANTLAEARPYGVERWVVDALSNRSFGRAREMLALAAARIAPAEVANPALIALLEDLPGHAAMALAECGGPAEAEALRPYLGRTKGWAKREIEKALLSIELR